MSISINFIEGRRGSACTNDAYAVVRNETDLLAIIPAYSLPARTGVPEIRRAFEEASAAFGYNRDKLVDHAISQLPVQGPSVRPQ